MRADRRALGSVAVLAALARAVSAQTAADADTSGAWRCVIMGTVTDPDIQPQHFKGSEILFLQQAADQLDGIALSSNGKCGVMLTPVAGAKAGVDFGFFQAEDVINPFNCSVAGTSTFQFLGVLQDGAKASLTGEGTLDLGAFGIHTAFTFTGAMRRISGMQTPDDPDGAGPAVPVSQIGSGEPGQEGAHDLAVTRLKAPKAVKVPGGQPSVQRKLTVQIQNRGQHDEVIADAATLGQVVSLQAALVAGGFGSVHVELLAPAPTKFPITLPPRRKLNVRFLATFETTIASIPGDGGSGPSGTFSWSAAVRHDLLPGSVPDDHAADDTAPRSVVAPFTFDAYPDGRIKERGVGAKKPDKTFGGPVLTVFSP